METPIKQPITAQDLTGQAFKSVETRMKHLASASDLVNAGMARIGGALTIGAIVGVGRAALNAADEINDMSQRLGISTEALSQYQHVAKMSGTDFEALANGIKYAQRAVSESEQGSRAAADALAQVGLSARDLKGMAPEAAFEAIGEAISKLPSASDRTAAAMKLFGRSGTELIPIFKDGAEGVRALREEADRLGLTLDGLSAEKAARANDAVDRMKAAFSGLARELALGAGPALENVATKLGAIVADVSLEMDWRTVNEASKQADWAIQVAFADAWRKGGKRGAIEYWRSYQEESARIARTGIFSRETPLFPGMTEGGQQAALTFRTRAVPEILAGLKSVEVATDGLTESERAYFQALERSVMLAQQRAMHNDSALESGLVELVDLDETTRQKEAEALERHNREVQRAVDEYEQLKRESQITWQMMTAGIDLVTDQLSNNLAAAIMGAKRQLIDLASIAEMLLGMAFRYAIGFGINALFPGAGAVAGVGMQGPTPSGAPLGKSMSAIPGPGSGAVTVVQNVTVKGTVDANNRLSVRRLAEVLYDEQLKIQKHHGPMGATA